MPILMSNSSHRSCKMEALVGSCSPICSYLLQRTWAPGTAGLLKGHWRTGQPPARKETTHSSGRGFLCWHSLCRELLSCIHALFAKLWNIKGNVVVKTWRVWVGQQLLSTRSPSAISLHAMNFSPAGFSFEKYNPILVFWAGLVTGCIILCGVEVSWLVPLIQQSWKAWEASLEQSSISGYPNSPFTLNHHKKSATLPSPPLQSIDTVSAGLFCPQLWIYGTS